MDRETFTARLADATNRAIALALEVVSDSLPHDAIYLIRPNVAVDDKRPRGDDEAFYTDQLPLNEIHLPPMDAAATVDYLWRDGRVPLWINLQVASADNFATFLFIHCTGAFTASMRYFDSFGGNWPFNPRYPHFPQNWILERLELIKQQKRKLPRGVPISLPSMSDMVARHGKFKLENRLIEWWQEAVERSHM